MEFCRTLSFLEVEFNNLILTDHECLKDFLFLMSCHFIVIQFNFYGENMNNNPFFIWQLNFFCIYLKSATIIQYTIKGRFMSR